MGEIVENLRQLAERLFVIHQEAGIHFSLSQNSSDRRMCAGV